MTDKHSLRSPRNPADLLGLGTAPALSRLLRACGADEACITGCASDYDKFLALAAALPLCEGHPLQDEVNRTLAAATGLGLPLCPHTAQIHWDAWVDRHWYGTQNVPAALLPPCPLCTRPAPYVLWEQDLTRLPDPLGVLAPDLAAWSAALEAALPSDGAPVLFTLPADYAFARPNPYHAGLAVGKVKGGEELTVEERDLLITQALRVWGLALTCAGQTQKTHELTLLLCGGDPAAVTALVGYLNASKALPAMAWIPDNPAHAEALSGLYAGVGTGYIVTDRDVPDGVSADTAGKTRGEYAKVAPIGRATLLIQ